MSVIPLQCEAWISAETAECPFVRPGAGSRESAGRAGPSRQVFSTLQVEMPSRRWYRLAGGEDEER